MNSSLHNQGRKFHKAVLYRDLKADIKKINHESETRPGEKQKKISKLIKSKYQKIKDTCINLYINK